MFGTGNLGSSRVRNSQFFASHLLRAIIWYLTGHVAWPTPTPSKGFWSLIKRGVGTYHKVRLYVAEFQFRCNNNRLNDNIFAEAVKDC